jgi:hypothetical protein
MLEPNIVHRGNQDADGVLGMGRGIERIGRMTPWLKLGMIKHPGVYVMPWEAAGYDCVCQYHAGTAVVMTKTFVDSINNTDAIDDRPVALAGACCLLQKLAAPLKSTPHTRRLC